MKVSNKVLYEKIMNDISKVLKKTLNETQEINIDPSYIIIDNKYGHEIINCENIKLLPENIIINLINELISFKNVNIEFDQENPKNITNKDLELDDNEFNILISLPTIKNIENENIYIRTIDYYNLTLFGLLIAVFDSEEYEWDETYNQGSSSGSEFIYTINDFHLTDFYLLEDFCKVTYNGKRLNKNIFSAVKDNLINVIHSTVINDIENQYNEEHKNDNPNYIDPLDKYKNYIEDNL